MCKELHRTIALKREKERGRTPTNKWSKSMKTMKNRKKNLGGGETNWHKSEKHLGVEMGWRGDETKEGGHS